jgi:hypothetical protein
VFIVEEFWFLAGWDQATQADTCVASASFTAVESISESGTCAAAATLTTTSETLVDQATLATSATTTADEALAEGGSNTVSGTLSGSGDANESAVVEAFADFIVDEDLVDAGSVVAVAFLDGAEEGGTPAEAPGLGAAIAFVWVGPSAQIRIYLTPRAAAEISSRTAEGDLY